MAGPGGGVLPRKNLTRAAQWIVRTLEQLDIEQIKNQYAFASHAADALALAQNDAGGIHEDASAKPQDRANRAETADSGNVHRIHLWELPPMLASTIRKIWNDEGGFVVSAA